MEVERKLKIVVFEVLLSVILCILMIGIKFVLKEEKVIEEIYNYLITDIVFPVKT